MKRSMLILLMVVMMGALCACSAQSPAPTDTPSFPFATLSPTPSPSLLPTPSPTPTPMMQLVIYPTPAPEDPHREPSAYERLCQWFLDTFQVNDDLDYWPTNLDGVNYSNFCCSIAGVGRDGDSYAAYSGYSPSQVRAYLDYLRLWGYDVREAPSLFQGMQEYHLSNPIPKDEQLLTCVRIYYHPEMECVVIAYPYEEALTYRAWSEHSRKYPAWQMPKDVVLGYMLNVALEYQVIMEKLEFRKEVKLTVNPATVTYPYSWDMMYPDFVAVEEPESHVNPIWTLQADRDGGSYRIPCLKLSFGKQVDKQYMNQLCIALAEVDRDFSALADLPMLYALEQDGAFTPWHGEETDTLWVIFPTGPYHADMQQRVYMRVKDQDNPWIADMREWVHADFLQETE